MSKETIPVSVTVMGKTYQINCPADEEEELHSSVEIVDEQMHEISKNGRIIGTDRIAVMAAINIAHDLLKLQEISAETDPKVGKRLRRLRNKVNKLLHNEFQLG